MLPVHQLPIQGPQVECDTAESLCIVQAGFLFVTTGVVFDSFQTLFPVGRHLTDVGAEGIDLYVQVGLDINKDVGLFAAP